MVYILLGRGFEETEAVVPCDLLRRAGVEVQLASIGEKTVIGSHGIAMVADIELKDIDFNALEMLVLPGGLKGVETISGSEQALLLVRCAFDAGRYVAAICAAPTILAKLGITSGKRATCYPGMESQMPDAKKENLPAVTDGRVITGEAAGSSFAFALELIKALKGEAAASCVAQSIVC